jgi:exopolysaccharide biosynthesis predicted pyruvyltransferase EpsI
MLLPINEFSKIFEPFKNKKIALVIPPGNAGDKLIVDGCLQLLNYYEIAHYCIQHDKILNAHFDCDEIAICGGGNMGSRYIWQHYWSRLKKYLFSVNKPITVLPQSYTDSPDLLGYKKVWVREKESFKWCPEAELAPDLALALDFKESIANATKKLGIWLRTDEESISIDLFSDGDPAKLCNSTEQYIKLAADYEEIITNRLHFAIAGLIAKRKVTLMSNSYYKNKAVYDCWLKNLCSWKEK